MSRATAGFRPRTRGSRRFVVAFALAGTALAAGACGSGSSGTGTTATTTTAPASGSTGAAMATVKSEKVGSMGAVLVDAAGYTLYRYTPDHNGISTCTATCASTWPPLVVKAGTSPTGVAGLGTTRRSDGALQVTYKDEPLYTYSGDTAPGQANGEGIGGVWFVVHPGSSGTSGSTTTTTRAGGGGGYP